MSKLVPYAVHYMFDGVRQHFFKLAEQFTMSRRYIRLPPMLIPTPVVKSPHTPTSKPRASKRSNWALHTFAGMKRSDLIIAQ
ncbi:hypothetical protein ACIQU2_07030 [Pseudomonas sp. NPDC098740]|uniref:hypothetical protein n=1 Tax=Pseudomonas sp. NPDC098740 TaxID=3364486 RepID=UPI00383AA4B8